MIEKLSRLIIKQRLIVIIAIIALTVLASFGFTKFKVSNVMNEWLPDNDNISQLFNQIGDTFITNKMLVIVFKPKSGEVFEKEFLASLKEYTDKLKEQKEVFTVISLTNVSNVKKIEGGIEVNDLVSEVPESESELAKLKEYVLNKEEYVNNVISEDGRYTGIIASLSEDVDDVKVTGSLLMPMAEEMMGDEADIFMAGIPSDGYWSNHYAVNDMKKLTPLVVLLMIVILWISFKNPLSIFMPIVGVLMAVIWTYGYMLAVNRPINVVTSAIPIILISIGVAYGIHVVNAFFLELKNGDMDTDKASNALSIVFVPVLLSGLTTFVGFCSFATARLKLMVWFGIFSAIGVVFAMIIALTFLPALLSYFKMNSTARKIQEKKAQKKDLIESFLRISGHAVLKGKYLIIIGCIAVMILALLGVPKIKREVNFVKYFPVGSTPRVSTNLIRDEFGGAYFYNLYMETESAKDPAVLKQILKAEYFGYSIPGTTESQSVADYISELNWNMNDRYSIPDTQGAVANLWIFIEGREMMKQMVTSEEDKLLSTGKVSEFTTTHQKRVSNRLDWYMENEAPGALVEIAAESLPEDKLGSLRKFQADEIAKQILWMIPQYSNETASGFEPYSKIISDAHSNPVKLTDSIFRAEIESVLENYIYSDAFELYVEEEEAGRIYEKVLETLDSGAKDYQSYYDAVAGLLSPEVLEEEDWAVESIAETIEARISESLNRTSINSLWTNLLTVLPANLSDNSHFRKKAQGVIYQINDGFVGMDRDKAAGLGLLDYEYREIPLRFEHNGMPALNTRLDGFLYSSLIQSLAIAIVVVFIMMTIQFRSFSVGLVAITPIIFTVAIVFGIMGYMGVNLDYGTMLIPPICIGIGIDYTIHYIHRYRREVEMGCSYYEAVVNTNISSGRAILSNAIAVMLGFLLLLMSEMYVLRAFGWITALTMVVAAFGAMTIVPSFILIVKGKNGKEEKK
ncbi:MAG TPA: MMPL family transporter [bacterium]|nr:MMPL family transporter [bacterium]